MRDQIFAGRDVQEALAQASRALGMPEAELRYIVLEREARGDAPARIAVLLDAMAAAAAAAPRPQASAPERPAPQPGLPDAASTIGRILAALAAAAGRELRAERVDDPQALRIRLSGPGTALLLNDGGRPLQALEHVVKRALQQSGEPARLRLECEGFREQRDGWLRARARELAAAVRRDGRPHETEPLNPYDRRILHIAGADEPGIRTFSVGEGADRRVTFAPSRPPDEDAGR
jgi:spoIIIJ-associated protein